MIDYTKFPNRHIAILDMISFYASCIATLHDLDVQKVPIAVVGNLKQKGSVVLAASPPMKKRFLIKTGSRLYEIPNHPEIKLFNPQMNYFLEMSMEVTKILHKYAPPEAIHVYSVDESFIDLTGTEKLWGEPADTVKEIQKDICTRLNLPSTAGMGPNMLMAKLALDLEAKKTGFAQWGFEDIPTKLWPVYPLSEMWGIGRKTEKKLNQMGILTVGDLAHASLASLEAEFGVMGNQYYHHAWGIDLSKIGDTKFSKGQVSYGKSQILLRDYQTHEEVNVVILEMCEDVARRAREKKQAGRTISLGIGYSKHAYGGGFYRSRTLPEATNDTMEIYKVCQMLFNENYDHRPVRQVSVSISKLEDEAFLQLSLFDLKKWQIRQLGETMDDIRSAYGSTALLRAVSLTDAGTAITRSKLVGGHKE